MASAAKAGKQAIGDDYKDTLVEKTLKVMASGQFIGDGDPAKAAKAIYETVVGEGVGEGKESELLLPLGRDMEARVKLGRDRLDHCWEAFGDVAMNVYNEK